MRLEDSVTVGKRKMGQLDLVNLFSELSGALLSYVQAAADVRSEGADMSPWQPHCLLFPKQDGKREGEGGGHLELV